MAQKRKMKPKKAARRHTQLPHHHHRPDMPMRGIVFDLCCGNMDVATGIAGQRGRYKVDLDAHGFSIAILLSEEQAMDLGNDLLERIRESKKGVN